MQFECRFNHHLDTRRNVSRNFYVDVSAKAIKLNLSNAVALIDFFSYFDIKNTYFLLYNRLCMSKRFHVKGDERNQVDFF